MRAGFLAATVLACSAAVPAPAAAQIDQPSWGITASFSPLWRVPDRLGGLLDVETVDISGYEVRAGLVRGTTFGGEWGITAVHKRLSKTSAATVRQGEIGIISVVADDAEMIGVEVHRYFPFARAGRTQIGVNVGGGVAQMRGFVTGSLASAGGAVVEAPIPFDEAVAPIGRDWAVLPLARAELAVAIRMGDRVKIRVGGGFNMPGIQLGGVSVSWLLGTDER